MFGSVCLCTVPKKRRASELSREGQQRRRKQRTQTCAVVPASHERLCGKGCAGECWRKPGEIRRLQTGIALPGSFRKASGARAGEGMRDVKSARA